MVWCVAFGYSNGEKKHQEEKRFFVLTSSHSCIRWWTKHCAMKLTNAKEFDAGHGRRVRVESDNSWS